MSKQLKQRPIAIAHFDRANIIAVKINVLINQARYVSLSRLSTATIKELWAAVNKTGNSSPENKDPMLLQNADLFNDYFAKIASKDSYDCHELDKFCCEDSDDRFHILYNYEVEKLLSKLKLTAAGCDLIPVWVLRSCSFELADIVTHILNCSAGSGNVPIAIGAMQ